LKKSEGGLTGYGGEKHSVATPQREWIKGPLRNWIRDYVSEGLLVQRTIIDRERFLMDFDAYVNSANLGNSFFVWKVLNLEALFRTTFSKSS
jgi:hypothetical protein